MAERRDAGPGELTPPASASASPRLARLQAELLEHIEAQSQAAAIPAAPATASGGWLAAALIAWLAALSLLVFKPAFVAGPVEQPWSSPASQREASLRYGVWLANGSVQRFVAKHGRLPSFPGEAGVTDTTITMRVTGERSYELVGTEGEATVKFSSSESADAFLGESVRELRGN